MKYCTFSKENHEKPLSLCSTIQCTTDITHGGTWRSVFPGPAKNGTTVALLIGAAAWLPDNGLSPISCVFHV